MYKYTDGNQFKQLGGMDGQRAQDQKLEIHLETMNSPKEKDF